MVGERGNAAGLSPTYTEVDLAELRLPNRVFRHRHFDFFIDEARVVTSEGVQNPLRNKEHIMLAFFCANPNRVLSHEEIYRYVWAENGNLPCDKKLIKVLISTLRAKLGDSPDKHIIRTRNAMGYYFIDPERPIVYTETELANQDSLTGKVYRHTHLDFFEESAEIVFGNKRVELLPIETKLMTHFMREKNVNLSLGELGLNAWGEDYIVDDNTVRVYVYRLRKILRDMGVVEEVIKTIHGVGYRLVDADWETEV